MVIEYIGSIIRNEVANKRERIYESQVNLKVTIIQTPRVMFTELLGD
jgi:hypothetical protein